MLEYRTLRPEELDAWYAHCESVFISEPAEYFRNHFVRDPAGDCDLIFVALDGGEIVSTVRVFDRTVWLFGRAVPMGGIGEVSTKSAYRRQGIAERLLNMAIAAMRQRSMPISILFGDQPLYARLGWRSCPSSMTIVASNALPAMMGSMEVRPYRVEDLPYLMGAYDFFAGRLNGALLRREAYWRCWVLAEWQQPSIFVLDGRPVGYCCARTDGVEGALLAVNEVCAAPHAEGALPSFLRAIAEAHSCERIRFLSPLLAGLLGETVPLANVMMMRLNAPVEGITDSDALVAAVTGSAGMFPVDHF